MSDKSLWRIARSDDDEAVISMCLALNREDPGPRPVPVEHTRASLARFRDEPVRGKALVLDVGGRLEGYCLLASFWSNELGGEICVIDELYVSPDARSQGHGRRLLEELIAGSPLWGRKAVAFDLEHTPNNARARKFYESLGFRQAKNAHMRIRF